MYKTPPPIEDVRLVAWHHMINDPYLITYTMVNGEPYKQYVNPKLAYKRSLLLLSQSVDQISHEFIKAFKPSFDQLDEVLQRFGNSFKQAGLHDILTDPNTVD
jgi:hypothetical protein